MIPKQKNAVSHAGGLRFLRVLFTAEGRTVEVARGVLIEGTVRV